MVCWLNPLCFWISSALQTHLLFGDVAVAVAQTICTIWTLYFVLAFHFFTITKKRRKKKREEKSKILFNTQCVMIVSLLSAILSPKHVSTFPFLLILVARMLTQNFFFATFPWKRTHNFFFLFFRLCYFSTPKFTLTSFSDDCHWCCCMCTCYHNY